MPNPYSHFLKLELNEADLKQLEDAYYGKKPQTGDSSFLKLELNEEDLKQLEDAFYSKDSQATACVLNLDYSQGHGQQGARKLSQEIEAVDSLKKRTRDFAKEQEDNNLPPLKQKSYWLPEDHKKRMTENMFKLSQTADNQLSLKPRKDSSWTKNISKFDLKKDNQGFKKEESQPVKDKKIIFVNHQIEKVRKHHPQKSSPQNRFMFDFNTNTGELIKPQKEDQDKPSFTVGKP
ncbi:hypothetical protein [Legionella cherrii]|uniref:Uncharacterized protein n=1 Tax=Legionella cherrii TaxID=28084 RepID=A0A0W0S948_9GAMM|nr:hypothetical protein [Legionella cherrii]KTC79943.1 hypothetical protein Lche_1963 [Legionella cherrii]VEB38309.1 Uncharacterised protein [Legionella cherrii]